jgi:predicted DNA-binding transcriptional regulator YafY
VIVSKECSVVEHILLCGEVPSTAKELGTLFGVDGATIRRIINEYRSDGIPICANHNGYYYSENPEEIVKTVASLKRRVASIQNAINGLLKNVEVSDAD